PQSRSSARRSLNIVRRAAVAARIAVIVLQPAMVAAQPLLQIARRLIGAEIGIGRHRIGAQHDPGIEMHHAFGVEAECLLADRGMAGKSAIEILFERFEDAGADALAQSFTELDVFAGYTKGHGWTSGCSPEPNAAPRQSR